MSELKPCPFCGYLPTKHIVRNADGVDGWVVECLKCKGEVWFWKASIHEAIAAWNTRDSKAEAVEAAAKQCVEEYGRECECSNPMDGEDFADQCSKCYWIEKLAAALKGGK